MPKYKSDVNIWQVQKVFVLADLSAV